MTDIDLIDIKNRYKHSKKVGDNVSCIQELDFDRILSEIDKNRGLFKLLLSHSCHSCVCNFSHQIAALGLSHDNNSRKV